MAASGREPPDPDDLSRPKAAIQIQLEAPKPSFSHDEQKAFDLLLTHVA
jgi:hypothetical protein